MMTRVWAVLASLILVVAACQTPAPTATPVPPPPTATSVPPTAIPVPPTNTPVPPSPTSVPPTATPVPPSPTPVPPTATAPPAKPTIPPPPAPTATAVASPPTATPRATAAGIHAVGVVEDRDYKTWGFRPPVLEVRVGETVLFTNDGAETHNFISLSAEQQFGSSDLKPGGTFRIQMIRAAEIRVICDLHANMEMRIRVGP